MASVAVISLSAIGVATWAVSDVVTDVKPVVTLAGKDGQAPPDVNSIEGGVNILLIGSDTRKGQGDGYGDPTKLQENLNDVTIVLHISEDHTNAVAVSIPRDTFVPIPSCPREDGSGSYSAMSSQKINATLQYGGIPCTQLTVEALTGLTIDYAALVKFTGVVALANAIGGVDVCLAAPIRDEHTDLDLPAGEVTLEGEQAIQFLRTRYGVGDGSDLGRISNQQVYLSALMRKLKSSETLANPVKLYTIAKVAFNNMYLSEGLDNLNTMVAIAMALGDIPTENIVFAKYPTASGHSNGQPGEFPVKSAADVLFDAIKADQGLEITGGTGRYGAKEKVPSSGTPPPSNSQTPPASTAPSDATTDDRTELPDAVTGQSAADVTCSNGQG